MYFFPSPPQDKARKTCSVLGSPGICLDLTCLASPDDSLRSGVLLWRGGRSNGFKNYLPKADRPSDLLVPLVGPSLPEKVSLLLPGSGQQTKSNGISFRVALFWHKATRSPMLCLPVLWRAH